MQAAAVGLVEFVFLSNWLLLEHDKNAPTEIKTRYALTAASLYIGLWILALSHGEGLIGMIFRASLGAALIGSGWDTYVLAWQKVMARADRDINSLPKVRRYALKRQEELALLEIDSQYKVSTARLELETSVSLSAVKLEADRRQKAIAIEHHQRLEKVSQTEDFPYPLSKARDTANQRKRDRRDIAKAQLLQILRDNPDASLRDIGDALAVSHETARRYLDQLEAAGIIHRNGNRDPMQSL
jgi:predicted transcriptional regulator